MRVRVSGALSDLHSADGHYHDDCCKRFMNPRNVHTAANSFKEIINPEDSALDALIEEMPGNKTQVWNFLELHNIYSHHGGASLSRRKLVDHLVNHFGVDLFVLSGNGVASILVFRSKSPGLLKLVDDSCGIDVKPIAQTFKKECLEKSTDRNVYKTRLFLEDVSEVCSDLLLKILVEISPKPMFHQ